MITRTTEYALRALLYLSRCGDRPVPAGEIARAIGAPANYLSKTLNGLTHHGLVRGRRGPRGGYRLAMPPARVPLATVVEAFDETLFGGRCLLGERACNPSHPCAAHAQWSEVWGDARSRLRNLSLADLLGEEPTPLEWLNVVREDVKLIPV